MGVLFPLNLCTGFSLLIKKTANSFSGGHQGPAASLAFSGMMDVAQKPEFMQGAPQKETE